MKIRRLASISCWSLVTACTLAACLEATRQTVDACSISWDPVNNTALQATSGSFGNSGSPVELDTTTVIGDGEGCFELHLAYTPGTSTNIATCTVNPKVFTCVSTGNEHSDLYGTLTNANSDGTAVVSAWDGTNWNCTGTHYRAVHH